ncbi:S-layer homology domain-containing protein [Anaerocolumna sp. AGMB13025]|uniref:S-layer homology domain-containing protein n=1 Tax=Anaerocolumna sp. AGMB13025 TaxID=3039116 RepID=UPI00241CEDB8|nr:S-layer homology domain-containing protein [Anaerocolumna sp. AGMB13025]WFR58725.1 S-layer homology domain-containing protein [Anaerocolumna sp. AGMB13025]
MMKNLKNKGLSLLLAMVVLVTTILSPAQIGAEAATSSKIKLYNFIKLTVQATGLQVETTYLNAALKAGIVKVGDFSDYSKYTTRTDAAVILNRADEYLHGDKVDADLLSLILSSRISDIKKINADKREAVAKIYAKGFIKGYSNGYYIKSREFRGSEYMTTGGAKSIVSMLKDTKKRAKLSPDGQLIRTTNLPKNASKYEYILETYPNSFYEMKFMYQRAKYSFDPVEGKDYASPVKVGSSMVGWLETDSNGKCVYVDDWMKKVELNLKTRLNVDYRTVDTTWLNNLRSTYYVFGKSELNKDTTDDIKEYIQIVKKNKIVIKSSVISVEPSTLYLDASYRVRVYVKFKISFAGDKMAQEDLFFGRIMQMYNLKKDKWFTGIYDIEVGTRNGSSDGSDFAVSDDSFNDYFYKGENK